MGTALLVRFAATHNNKYNPTVLLRCGGLVFWKLINYRHSNILKEITKEKEHEEVNLISHSSDYMVPFYR